MLVTLLTLAVIGVVAIVWSRFRPQWNIQRSVMAACVVLAISSAYSLFTEPPDSASFRFHVGLLLFAVVAMFYRSQKLRST